MLRSVLTIVRSQTERVLSMIPSPSVNQLLMFLLTL